jgi:hypothetical protein
MFAGLQLCRLNGRSNEQTVTTPTPQTLKHRRHKATVVNSLQARDPAISASVWRRRVFFYLAGHVNAGQRKEGGRVREQTLLGQWRQKQGSVRFGKVTLETPQICRTRRSNFVSPPATIDMQAYAAREVANHTFRICRPHF